MTVRSPHSATRAAFVAALVVVAACGSSTPPSASAPPASGTSVPSATAAPASSSGAPASPTPSPAAVHCEDTGGAAPSPSSDTSDPNAALYAKIEGQVSALRGLEARTPVARSVFDTAGLCAYLRASFTKDNPAAYVKATERLYKELLLLPADASLETLSLDLLTSQVAGLYDDKTKHMYVVSSSGAIGPLEEVTYAHEYTHALQDQAFDLESIMGTAKDQGDRQMARSALIEGDATLVMSLWAQQNLSAGELGKIAGAADPASQALLDSMPVILKDTLLFPYTAGLKVALGAWQAGGGFAGVDDLLRHPPDSTEQILHPDKLASREAPAAVAFPADLAKRLGAGWSVALQDTLGEAQLEILLREGGAPDSTAAAAGWGGDRIALVEGPDGAVGVVLDTAWDTTADAGEFAAALAPLVSKLTAAGRSATVLTPAPGRVVLAIGSSSGVMGRLANVLGLAG